jgi:hypothetical protein
MDVLFFPFQRYYYSKSRLARIFPLIMLPLMLSVFQSTGSYDSFNWFVVSSGELTNGTFILCDGSWLLLLVVVVVARNLLTCLLVIVE